MTMIDQPDALTRPPGTRGTAGRWMHLVNWFTLWVLRTPLIRRLADGQVCELRFTSARGQQQVVLPVMYAQRGSTVVVLVGGAQRKRWWRSFATPRVVHVLLRGTGRTGLGRVVMPGSADRADAATIYTIRHPKIPVEQDPIVVIQLDPAG
jgi:hypothetical protein